MKKSVLCSVAIKAANQLLGSIKKSIQNKPVTIMIPPPHTPMVSLNLEQRESSLHPRMAEKVAEGVEETSTHAVSVRAKFFSMESKPPWEGRSQSLHSPEWQSVREQGQTDHCLFQLETQQPSNLARPASNKRRCIFSTQSSCNFVSQPQSLV